MEAISWVVFIAFLLYVFERITIPVIAALFITGIALFSSATPLAVFCLTLDGLLTVLWLFGRFVVSKLVRPSMADPIC